MSNAILNQILLYFLVACLIVALVIFIKTFYQLKKKATEHQQKLQTQNNLDYNKEPIKENKNQVTQNRAESQVQKGQIQLSNSKDYNSQSKKSKNKLSVSYQQDNGVTVDINKEVVVSEKGESSIINNEGEIQDIQCHKNLVYYALKIENSQYTHIIFSENEIFYGNFTQYDDFQEKNGLGYHYKITYDENMNPKYQIYKGQFKKNQRNGIGILYEGKSTNIAYDGAWNQDEKVKSSEAQIQSPEITLDQPVIGPKKIIIMENGQIINNQTTMKVTPLFNESWIMYNQQITNRDIKILSSNSGWFTSSIIDAFTLYLNIQHEKLFLSIGDSNQQKNYDRIIILPSDLFTSMHDMEIIQNKKTFEKHVLEYQPINFEIGMIFKKILFVINHQNVHWFLTKVDLANQILHIYDSMKKQEQSYLKVFNILNGIFDNQLMKINVVDTYQQNNGYDCGPCTCLNMLKESGLKINLGSQGSTPKAMRQFLFQLLKQK